MLALAIGDEAHFDADLFAFLQDAGIVGLDRVDAEDLIARVKPGSLKPYELAIVDSGLLEDRLTAILKTLRDARDGLPVLSISSDDDHADCIRALEAGVNDWLPRSFDPHELVLRIRSLVSLRRALPTLVVDGMEMDLARRRVTRGQDTIELTPREYDLLLALAEARGATLSKERLLAKVWGLEDDPGTQVVEVQIARLRKKVDARGPAIIHTVPGEGYKLCYVRRLVFSGTRAADRGAAIEDASCIYRIDREDRVVQVEGCWDEFAALNGSTAPGAGQVLGQRVWDHIGGGLLGDVYRRIVRIVRSQPEEFVLSFACSSPEQRRSIELAIRPVGRDGEVEFESRLWRQSDATGPRQLEEGASSCGFCEEPVAGGVNGMEFCRDCGELLKAEGLLRAVA